MVKDFDHFVDRGSSFSPMGKGTTETDVMWQHMIPNMNGEAWRQGR